MEITVELPPDGKKEVLKKSCTAVGIANNRVVITFWPEKWKRIAVSLERGELVALAVLLDTIEKLEGEEE